MKPNFLSPKKQRSFFLLAVSVFVLVFLFNIKNTVAHHPAFGDEIHMPPNLVVETDWLKEHFNEPGIIIVDVRNNKQFQKEHIKGAVNIPVDSTFGGQPNSGLVAPISHIQNIFSRAGIDNNVDVVIYDDGTYFDAARVFWVFEVYGHKHVGLLNGGLDLWKKLGLPTSSLAQNKESKSFIPTVVPDYLSTKLSTRLAVNDDSKLILDARTSEEYSGKKSKTKRFGHIPGAINIPAKQNYTGQNGINVIKPIEELERLYSAIDKNKKVITYCNKGRESALTYFILRRLGFNVSAYDGSWYEWSNDPSLPVALPDSHKIR